MGPDAVGGAAQLTGGKANPTTQQRDRLGTPSGKHERAEQALRRPIGVLFLLRQEKPIRQDCVLSRQGAGLAEAGGVDQEVVVGVDHIIVVEVAAGVALGLGDEPVLRKVSFLAMALPHSDAMFVMAFERSPHASGAYPGSQRRELSAAAVQAAAETPGQA